MEEKVTTQFPAIDEEIKEAYLRKGITHCQISYYSTFFETIYDKIPNTLLEKFLEEDSRIQLKEFTKGSPRSFQIQRHFHEGKEKLECLEGSGLLFGRYLVIITPIKDKKPKDVIKDISIFISALTLIYGSRIAMDLHLSYTKNFQTGAESVASNCIWSSKYLDYEVSFGEAFSISVAESILKLDVRKKEIFSILAKSHHESDPTHRFLCLWLALEIAIGKGDKRKLFAEQEIKSEALNVKMNELRGIRDDYVHDGKLISPTIFHEQYLKLIIALKLFEEEKTRNNLLHIFEQIHKAEEKIKNIDLQEYALVVTSSYNDINILEEL